MAATQYIFNHIPKTGGISLLAVCRDNLDPAEISPHLNFTEMHLMPATRFEGYRLVAGHLTLLAQIGFCRNRYSITLLREPIRRIFSAYTFWRTQPYDPLTAKAKELEFPDFVRYFADSPAIIHNPYTYHLAALGLDCAAWPTDEGALLTIAKRNLAAYNFVGICEELGASIRLLCAELGWRPPAATPHINRSSSEKRFSGIDPPTMTLLRDRNRLDMALYAYAVELFHAREAAGSKLSDGVEPNYFKPFPASSNASRRATVLSSSCDWLGDEHCRMLAVTVEFKAHVAVPDLTLGVQFTSPAGDIVWGTNTSMAFLELACEPGRNCRAVFTVECFLPRGLYFLTVALSEPRRLGFHDHWIDHATSFTVTGPRAAQSGYLRGVQLREFSSVLA